MIACKYSCVVFEIPKFGENQNVLVNPKIGQINNDTYATRAVSNKRNFQRCFRFQAYYILRAGMFASNLQSSVDRPFLSYVGWYVSHQTRKSKAIPFIDA